MLDLVTLQWNRVDKVARARSHGVIECGANSPNNHPRDPECAKQSGRGLRLAIALHVQGKESENEREIRKQVY